MVWRSPGQRAKLSASELNRTNAVVQRVERSRLGLTELTASEDQQSHWVWLRNDSGSDRKRFDCMSLGDPLFEMLDDGTVDLLFKGLTAAVDKTPAILLEPIANGEMGKAVIHGLALARVGSGSTSARTATPDATNHRLKPGGEILLLAAPHASEVKLLPVLLGAGSRESILIKTPVGGIPAATGSGPYTWGSATCKVVTDAGVVTAADLVIKNIVNKAIAANVQGKADPVGSIYVIDVASCGS